MREKISVCIITGNEENNIRRCLRSVTWADEIVVVDSFSTDNTVKICREYTELIYQHRWLGYIGQKNLIKDLATGTWILFVDADEEISPALRDEILDEFNSGRFRQMCGYEFPRMVRHLRRWIRHGDWYPDIKLRLFRRSSGKCGGREPHDRILVDGPVKRLQGPMYHHTYENISEQIVTLNNFSTISAQCWHRDGKPFHLMDLIFRPPLRFLRCYFLKGGFLDGIPGLIIAATAAYGVHAKYAKLWESYLPPERDPLPESSAGNGR